MTRTMLHYIYGNLQTLWIRRLGAGILAVCVAVLAGACGGGTESDVSLDTAGTYVYAESVSEQGTGRFYMGREIAEVTGLGREEWLERPERETEELPNRVVRALELRPSDVVADIGAGTGYFTFRLSPHVPDGQVFAVDIEDEMLRHVRSLMDARGEHHVIPVLGTVTDPRLPADSLDVVLIVFTYTQFSHPYEMMVNIRRALKPSGRVVLVEYRAEDPTIPIAPVYTISEEQAIRELEAAGLRWRETRDILPQHHFMVFEKSMN